MPSCRLTIFARRRRSPASYGLLSLRGHAALKFLRGFLLVLLRSLSAFRFQFLRILFLVLFLFVLFVIFSPFLQGDAFPFLKQR